MINFELEDDEAKHLKKVLGRDHKDKDISETESAASFALYKKLGVLLKIRGITTKKVKKDAT